MLIDVMDLWLPVFLDAMDRGLKASEAVQIGRQAISQRFDHPLARLQLHVFGDAGFRIDNMLRT